MVQIDIPDDEIQYLTEPAKRRLEREIVKYKDDLLAEAGRLEAGRRGTTSDPQITDTEVEDATILVRRYARNRKNKWLMIPEMVAPIAALIVGVVVNQGLSTLENQILFIIFATVAIGLTLFNVLYEGVKS